MDFSTIKDLPTLIRFLSNNSAIVIMAVSFLWGILVAISKSYRSYCLQFDECAYTYQVGVVPVPAKVAKRALAFAVDAYAVKGQSEAEWRLALNERFDGQIASFNSSGVDGFTYWDDDHLYVSFRGTAGIFDVFKDAMAIPTRAYKGGAHRGFYKDATKAYERLGLREQVNWAIIQGKKIVATGHSYGAALSIEFAGKVIEHHGVEQVALVCALCAPRSSTKSRAYWLVKELGAKIFRITYSRDIVPMVPPPILYRHVGSTHYFDCNGEYHPLLTAGYRVFDTVCAVIRDLMNLKPFAFLSYHSGTTVRDMGIKAIDAGLIKTR